jgi:Carboxypeptidase regulatory-like domain
MRILLMIGLLVTIEVTTLNPLQILAMPLHMNRRVAPRVAPQFGGIEGTVVDGNGQPISGAEVRAEKSGSLVGKIPRALTDKLGKFTFKELPPGTYELSANKDDDGYPIPDSAFHYGRAVAKAKVTVYESQVTRDVIVKIGIKMGVLVLQVLNATTKEPIKNSKVTLRRADNPEYKYITGPYDAEGASKKIPAPSSPFTVEVSAPGYKIWRYRKEGSLKQGDSLQVAQGETKELTVLLSRRN